MAPTQNPPKYITTRTTPSVLHFSSSQKMFRNKFLVRAQLPSSLFHPFRLLQLSVSDSSSSIEIETLCWKLSRRWRLACLHPSPSSVFIIYQRCQNEEAARVVEEFAKTMAICKVGEEEEVRSAILIAKAVECWFRSLMMEKSWRCIGESTFVDSTFAVDEEKKYFPALNARVQSEIDGIVFIVSPDVIWFIRDKITDLVSSQALQSFQDGNVALVEKDRHFTACVTLPSLHSGHILGLSILTPVGEKFELLEELWKFKHGLSLLSDYYVHVHYSYGGLESKTWLPSAFVLRGPGLSPPPQRVRYSMAVNALNSFINTIGCLDFFSQGRLKVKKVSSLESPMMQPVWKAVGTACNENKNITDECITSQNLHLTLDFRAQKPAPWFTSANRMLGYDKKHAAAVWTSDEITKTTSLLNVPIPKPLNEVVQVAAKPPPLCQSQIYQRESGYRNDIITTVKPPTVACNAGEGSILQQRTSKKLLCSSKDVGDKMMSDTLNLNSSSKDKKAERKEALIKRTSDKENKISLLSSMQIQAAVSIL